MQKLFREIILLGLILFLVIIACAPRDTVTSVMPAAKITPPGLTKSAQEGEWEKTLAAAKQERKVDIITRFPASVRDGLAAAFGGKYGIEVEYTAGEITALWPKIEAERRAGLYLRDISMGSATGLMGTLVPGDAAEPMEPAFIFHEIKDVNVWRDKRLPFFDKEAKTFMFLARVGPTLVINKELVKPEEIRSWRNLLEPKWKGKILLHDPSIPGPGVTIIVTLGEIMGIDFLKELAKQDPVINRDMRLQVEWVAKGKYPVGLGFEFTMMEEMRDAGAPLAHVVPSEGTYFGSAVGGMAMFNRSAHPNAAKVFINWFLSKEGQTLLVKAAKEQSRRVDVTPELAPDRLFQESIKYVDFDTEYMLDKRVEMFKLSKEIFAAQYK